jgi:F-type H+-transporting ATPase subunit epsilon
MNSFVMYLQSPGRFERLDGVTSFVGADGSGSFGIMPNHERIMTILSPGIMRISRLAQQPEDQTEYLGVGGGVLYFVGNELFINTRKYLLERNYAFLSSALQEHIRQEAADIIARRQTIKHLEEALLRELVKSPRAVL